METINTIELRDETIYPDEEVLASIIGDSYPAYSKLLALYKRYEMTPEWRYYRDGKAWLCKVQKKKRTIVWMSAWKGYMQATVFFPEKYLQRVYSLDINKVVMDKIQSTTYVGKSKPCIFEIRNDEILSDFEAVMTLKIQCK